MTHFLKKCTAIGRQLSALRISVYSGNASFFLLLSLFPATMTLLGALKYLPATAGDLEALFLGLTPTPLHRLVRSFFAELSTANAAVVSASALGALWSMTRGVRNIMSGLDVVYHTQEHRSWLWQWSISLFGVLLLLLSILATLLLQVFGSGLYAARLRWPLAIGFLTLVFCMMYTALPYRRQKFAKNIPGALLAAAGWQGYSALYGLYVENFSRYTHLYGSLTTAAITLLWVYFCMNLLFYGGLFNYILTEVPHPLQRLWAYLRS